MKMTTTRRLLVRSILGATLLVLSVSALLYPSELVLNLVGVALLLAQTVALAVILNQRVRWRVFATAFLVASAAHAYGIFLNPLAAREQSYLDRFWHHPTVRFWDKAEWALA